VESQSGAAFERIIELENLVATIRCALLALCLFWMNLSPEPA